MGVAAGDQGIAVGQPFVVSVGVCIGHAVLPDKLHGHRVLRTCDDNRFLTTFTLLSYLKALVSLFKFLDPFLYILAFIVAYYRHCPASDLTEATAASFAMVLTRSW